MIRESSVETTLFSATQPRVLSNERGVALFSVFLAILMLTVIGIASLTVTGLENRMAGFASSMEASSAAAESCVATGVKVIQQVQDVSNGGTIPTALLSTATPPGPVPNLSPNINKSQLEAEIGMDATALPDTPVGPPFPAGITAAVPNLSFNLSGYTVVGDIDFLYQRNRAGATTCGNCAYHNASGGAGSTEYLYKVDCVATHTATGMSSRVSATYACVYNEGCQRRI